jgi:hypothetical protein
MSNGLVFYEGPSEIGGAPIIGIATLVSKNPKTGPMIQTWIMSTLHNPFASVKNKQDYAVCGNCPLRDNGCYVRTGQGPSVVWKAWKRGIYDPYDKKRVKSAAIMRTVRLGAYGDPAALPLWAITDLLSSSIGHTGYTHQWLWAEHLKPYCMASVESMDDYRLAKAMGWRTFRLRPEGGERLKPTEAQCPAAIKSNKALTCHQCLACGGKSQGFSGDISIEVHGSTKGRVFDA